MKNLEITKQFLKKYIFMKCIYLNIQKKKVLEADRDAGSGCRTDKRQDAVQNLFLWEMKCLMNLECTIQEK